MNMKNMLKEERFNFLSRKDKTFVIAFDSEMNKLGYDFGNKIDSGFCWGKLMIIYRKSGVKSKKVYARIYLRDDDIVLRLFFYHIDAHNVYIENAHKHIKEVFTGDYGNCTHCKNEKTGICRFRKSYTIDNHLIEKCNGYTFQFFEPSFNKSDEYLNLFMEFYPIKT